jgi:hypothetical protein
MYEKSNEYRILLVKTERKGTVGRLDVGGRVIFKRMSEK